MRTFTRTDPNVLTFGFGSSSVRFHQNPQTWSQVQLEAGIHLLGSSAQSKLHSSDKVRQRRSRTSESSSRVMARQARRVGALSAVMRALIRSEEGAELKDKALSTFCPQLVLRFGSGLTEPGSGSTVLVVLVVPVYSYVFKAGSKTRVWRLKVTKYLFDTVKSIRGSSSCTPGPEPGF